ncbi:MAG: alpha-L-fucosidase [Anaerolineae bacterium]|nr:alpha-L-fucosidase [Anaerolineae bacterium]
MSILPFRQVHLDFHTSPLIPDVGADFDPDEFVRTLERAAVNSVTVFARCHHGMCYYPTKVGVPHPSLKRDLLGEMIEACHRQGIQAPIYVTVVWDEHAGTQHPEWRQVNRSGQLVGRPPLSGDWGWQWLCMNTPYTDYVAALTEEICRGYPVDGIFFDIVMTTYPGCVCTHCLRSMRDMGLDPAVDADLRQHALIVERRFMRRMTQLVHSIHPAARVFYNSRLRLDPDPATGMRGEAEHYTHWEIESLPSGGWGYNHFPLFARYYQTLGKEYLGMTGRFHLSWADFGGLKNQAALEYECFRQLALGAQCSIGDQLHPRGRLDPVVYDLIGSVYHQVEACEPWCVDAVPRAEIGVLMPGAVDHHVQSDARDILEGAMRLLMEAGRQFHLVDSAADLSRYRLLVAPDAVAFGEALAGRVREYLTRGGALLLSHRSGLRPDGAGFALDEIGLDYEGAAPYAPNYFHVVEPANEITRGIAATDYVMYEAGSRVRPRAGTESLVEEAIPYFNRTWDHFCSHRQTPADRPSGCPLVTRRGRVIYFAAPIFHAFQVYGNRVYKELVRNAVAALLPEPLLKTGLPSAGEATLLEQACGPQGRRLVCHLLYYTPQRRSSRIDVVEDVVPLYDVPLGVRAGFSPCRVYLAPQEQDLPFAEEGAYVTCRVPLVRGHQMVVMV